MPERIIAKEMMKIPIDELPIEPIVIGDEERTPAAVGLDPGIELIHDGFGVGKLERFLAGESADGERLREPFVGNWLQFAVKRLLERWFDDDGTEADHRVVARYRTIGFDIDHDVAHAISCAV